MAMFSGFAVRVAASQTGSYRILATQTRHSTSFSEVAAKDPDLCLCEEIWTGAGIYRILNTKRHVTGLFVEEQGVVAELLERLGLDEDLVRRIATNSDSYAEIRRGREIVFRA